VALVLGSLVAYVGVGSGPFATNYAPAAVTEHSIRADAIIASLPADAALSASTSLVPHLTHRARVYVFPAVLDAEYVFLDLKATPAPTSAGDVYLRVRSLEADGSWREQVNDEGLLVLYREPTSPPRPPDVAEKRQPQRTADAANLVSATLLPPPDGAQDVDGPRWILRTTWRTDAPLRKGTRLEFWVALNDGEQLHRWDIANLWWNPPDRWTPGEWVTVDVPDIPIHRFASWRASWSST
jgi:hypothetical protein